MPSRLAVAVGLLLMSVVGAGQPAAAHGGASDATNYRIAVTEPGADGIDWRVYGGDSIVRMTNRTGADVVVAGYQSEPYLWFRVDGHVFENQSSPAAFLNEDRDGRTEVPASADPSARPRWERVATDGSFVWHDHRMHWMGGPTPAVVAANPDREHVIQSWTVPIEVDGKSAEATGQLRWEPPVSAVPFLAITSFAMLAVVGLAVVMSHPQGERWPGLGRTVALLVTAVAGANAVRTVDGMLALPASWTTHAVVAVLATVCLGVIVVLAARGRRGHGRGFAALAAAGLLTMLFFGADAWPQLTASQLPTELPEEFRRITVAASWAVLIPTVLAAGWAGNRYAAARADAPDRVVEVDRPVERDPAASRRGLPDEPPPRPAG